MLVDDFHFDLPDSLIAQMPAKARDGSRLMHVNEQGDIAHLQFKEVANLLRKNDLLIRNNTKVMKARLFGKKESGGKLEFLIERVLSDKKLLTQVKASKTPKIGDYIFLGDCQAEVLDKQDSFYELAVFLEAGDTLEKMIERSGHIPLPPYIKREDSDFDADRYQTVYADKLGAVAAPTAGLHFDQAVFESLENKGVTIADLTLYVGSGTFQPVRVDDIKEHKMHAERFEISEELVEKVKTCREKGGRVIALGTTSLRALESASVSGELKAQSGETDIFIYPGFSFKCVDALITNFHLPKSTLLMLVSAFSGKENMKNAYRVAVKESYRFFSYGDAMFVEKANGVKAKLGQN
jgi:S-adenosylmethionine:tRNA ribosyltransferase-isomerase